MPQKQPPASTARSVEVIRLLLHLSIEQLAVAAVPLVFELIQRDEAQRRGIDAVAQAACFARAVRKDMAQMAIAMAGANFRPNHAVGGVFVLDHIFGFDRPGEAGPTTVTVEFVVRSEERLARYDV